MPGKRKESCCGAHSIIKIFKYSIKKQYDF